ncbi:MAG: carbamoyltransferase HypF [Methylotenera sp.]|nr:carbamoyltransferase HypF [Methylotenera sp.]
MPADFIAHHISMPRETLPILAMGAFFNNTVCVTLGSDAYISYSLGNLDSPDACRQHEKIARQLLRMLDYKPHAIAHDLHPDFHSTRFAAQLAAELDVPLIAVQHHHAHIAAICAEHQLDNPVLGLALDGIGLGVDGNAWGGELLSVNGAEFQRIGHLHPLPLAGGDRAAQEPWRMAAAVLHEAGRNDEITQRFANQPAAATVALMLQRGLNCPLAPSMGRLFDAAAGLLGLCETMAFDAEAAIALEQAATRYINTKGWPSALKNGWEMNHEGVLNLLPTLLYLADAQNAGLENEFDVDYGAAIFHATLVAALADWLEQASRSIGITDIACGGGCFFNQLLTTELHRQSNLLGLKMYTAQTISPGDSAIALGQAWIAARKLL